MVNSQRSEPAGKRLSTMDDRVLGAAVELLAEEGYSALAFTRISERAGLSRRPVHDRYANRGDIALDIWNQVASGALIAALQSLYDSYEGADASREHFVEQMQNFFSPSEELHCALEILVVSQFDLCLSTAISESAVRDFEPLVHRGSNDAELRKATKRAYVTAFALGLALTSRMPASEPIDIDYDAGRLFDSLLLDAEQLPMPDVEGSLFAQPIPIETGDVQLDALLTAALDKLRFRVLRKLPLCESLEQLAVPKVFSSVALIQSANYLSMPCGASQLHDCSEIMNCFRRLQALMGNPQLMHFLFVKACDPKLLDVGR